MINSKFLVLVQFISIGVILYPKKTVTLMPFWWILLLIATVTVLWIFTHNKIGNFNIVPEIKDEAKLIVTGPYKFVRHPMYSSLILFMLGVVLWHFNWINLLALTIMSIAVILKAFKEEKLWHVNDATYEAYKKRTTMIIPFLL
jgi:protein-S-isoprenylcysteine O-methyltransferase Ste14